MPLTHKLLFALVWLILSGCGQFKALKQELVTLDNQYTQYHIKVNGRQSSDSVVLVLLSQAHAEQIDGFDVMIGDNDIDIQAYSHSQFLFVFIDENHDLRFQPNERYEWLALDSQFADTPLTLDLNSSAKDYPKQLVDKPLQNITNMQITQARFDEVIPLNDPIFSREYAQMGLWKPISHIQNGYTGLFFLEPYHKSKIPVILVHGMAGSAADFAPLVANIDQEKYQIWVFNYPSGLPLLMIAKGLDNLINITRAKYQFSQVHIVGHSMGGLVSKRYLNQCYPTASCPEILSFSSISSPFLGVKSAQYGVDYAPVAIPAWHDLLPESQLISELFTPNKAAPHMLSFGYKISGVINQQSGDGVINLSSQLAPQAQRQAIKVRGYNDDHVSILANEELAQDIMQFWQQIESTNTEQ